MSSPARLSPHFSFDELTQTSVRDVENTPGPEHLANLKRLCALLERARLRFGPLFTTSGFRSPAVNRIIGGSATSAHPDGRAWDGVPLARHVRWPDVIAWLLEHAGPELDQVIYEYGRWLHIGIAPEGKEGRRQALMIFSRGRYEPFNPQDPRVIR